MKLSVSIDVPDLALGVKFFSDSFGFIETARPIDGYAILKHEDLEIGLLEKKPGTKPAPGSDDVRRYTRHWTPVHVDFYVADFERTLERALNNGAVCEQKFEGGKHPPVAFCGDPFGNGFCIIGNV